MSERQWQFGDWCEYEGRRWRVYHADGTICRITDSDGFTEEVHTEYLTYLPDCTGWDWPPAPIDPGEGWRLLEKGELVDEGDEVRRVNGTWDEAFNWCTNTKMQAPDIPYRRRITPPLQLREGAWYERRDGKVVGPIERRAGSDGSAYPWITNRHWYTDNGSYTTQVGEHRLDIIREVPEPKPTYRPFASAEEFKPFRKYWIRAIGDRGVVRVQGYDERGAKIHQYQTYRDMFATHEFEDGTPFGIKE